MAVNLILNKNHKFKEALKISNIPTLRQRKMMPSARFAEKYSRNEKNKKHIQNHKGKAYNGNKISEEIHGNKYKICRIR